MTKLSDELPIIKLLKQRMSKDVNFTKDQVRDFERRVGRTYSLKFLVETIQSFHNQKIQTQKLCSEKNKEIKQLETINHANYENYQDYKEKCRKLEGENFTLKKYNERLKKRIEELEKNIEDNK